MKKPKWVVEKERLRKSEKEDFEFKIADNVTAMEKFQDLKSEASSTVSIFLKIKTIQY